MNQIENSSRSSAWLLLALVAALAAGCDRDKILGTEGLTSVAPDTTDTTRPRVTATEPVTTDPGPTLDVPVDTSITATFTEDMAPETITATSFTLTCDAPCVSPAGTVSYSVGTLTASFVPEADLENGVTYTATITTAATDLAGNALAGNQAPLPAASDYVWTFTTSVVPDTTRPRVIATEPVTTDPGPTPDVPPGTTITATFSERMAPATITASSFTLTCDAPCVSPAGAVSYAVRTRTASFVPETDLENGVTYTATITTAATDLAGNALAGNQAPLPAASDYVWTFTTQTAPTVIAVAPVNNATGVPINNTIINATFSERMQPITGDASFTVTCDAPCTSPTGTVALDDTLRIATFTLTPGTTLEPSTLYTARVTAARSLRTDLAMESPFTWSFTTGVASDTTRPRVTVTEPVTTDPGPTPDVPPNTAITAAFTEDMAAATINANSFTLTCNAPCVSPAGVVSYAVGTRTASFVPNAVLDTGVTYTATITTEATDLAGNALAGNQAPLPAASDYVWTFTTQTPPTVTAVAPVNNATGVPINNTIINAAFSERMQPITGDASFTVTCEAPCTSPTGTVALDDTGRIATFTLTPGTTLEPSTQYTARVTAARSLRTGLAMESPFTWRFTTGVAPDTTRPRVTVTEPVTTDPGPTPDVPASTSVTAAFTEDMAPATINANSFTLTCEDAPCVSPAGTVSYAVGTRTASFVPDEVLDAGVTYTATITTEATDLAGNALAGNQAPLPAASDYVWTFTTQAPLPPANVTVQSTNPADGAVNVCPDATVNATFDVPSGQRMDPATVNSATFTLTEATPAMTPVTAVSVTLDNATGRIATFTPESDLTDGVTYRATIKGGADGVKDLANPANGMVSDFSWTFTAGPETGDCLQPPDLRSASPFGVFGGSAGMTNQGLQTVINGDIGTTAESTAVTGFHSPGPGCTYTETPLNMGAVNGNIFTAPPPPTVECPDEGTTETLEIATQGRADALEAFNTLAGKPAGPDPGAGSLANLVLAPGVYTAAAGSFMIQGGDLTLDAQGNANGVWVFQMASTLTVGGPGAEFPQSIILINGAQAKNVFWQVGTAATINAAGGGTMVGTIISQDGASFSTAGNTVIVTLEGRVLSLGASVTLVDTVINVPAP